MWAVLAIGSFVFVVHEASLELKISLIVQATIIEFCISLNKSSSRTLILLQKSCGDTNVQ